MTRNPGTPAVVLRTMLTAPALSAFLVLAIAALALAGVMVPPLVDQARTATVQHQLDGIPAAGQALTGAVSGIAGLDRSALPRAGVWEGPLAAARAARDRQPEPLRGLLGTPRVVGLLAGTPLPADRRAPRNFVQLTMDPGLERRSALVQGAYPKPTDSSAGIEVVLTAQAARELDWKVGEQRRRQGVAVTLTGLVEPRGADDLDWDMLVGARKPAVTYTPDGDIILQTVGFLAPDEAGRLGDLVRETSTSSWIPVRRDAIDAGNAAAASAQLRLFLANPVDLGAGSDFYNGGLVYATPVADALDRGVARGEALVAVVAVAATGPLAVAGVVLALAGRQLALRRGRAAALARARGASLAQLAGLLGGEALLLGLIGAALGVTAGLILTRRAPDRATMVVAAVLVLVPVCAVLATAVLELRGAERRGGRARALSPWRRILIEAVVLVLTGALAAILLGRGESAAVDPVLLAMPLLIGAVGTVLVLRLLPLLLEALHRTSARRAGLIALLGPARALRDAALRTAPALAAVIGIAVAVFSVAFAATVSDGAARTARDSTGADVAVSLPYIDDDQIAAVRTIPGVAAVATLDADEIGQGASPVATDRVRIYALDRDAFVRVQQGFDGALPLPAALASTSGGAIPVVASEALIAQFGGGLTVNGHAVRIVARTAQQAPFGAAEKWVIVDRANIGRIGVVSPSVSRLFVSVGQGHDPAEVGKALRARLGPSADVVTAAQLIAQASSDPAFAALHAALNAAIGIVAILLALTIVQTLALGSTARARLMALLRAVGYPRRRVLPLVAWEVGPALLVALPVGVLCGAAMAGLVVGGLDLRGFTGGESPPALSPGAGGLAVVLLGFVLVAALAVLLATATAVRLRSADAIRMTDEEA
ncbi:FtsX-like permease family protein [Microbacterium sp. 22242]|uniref:FtsX-like permease family protein n=1 Tax=Microbacterium sp. 22242 TaxID=3453896 RepID=UPI003F824698